MAKKRRRRKSKLQARKFREDADAEDVELPTSPAPVSFVRRARGESMKPLVLTGWLISDFVTSNLADLAVHFPFHFVWGELPSLGELAFYLGPGTPDHDAGRHWWDFAFSWKESEG